MKAIFAFLALVCLSGDRIYLVDGNEYTGKLLRITEDSVFFATGDTVLRLPLEDVSSIDFKKLRQGDEWRRVDDITDTLLLEALAEDISRFGKAGYVNLYRIRRVILSPDSSMTLRVRRLVRVTGERGKGFANRSFLFFPDREWVSLDFARAVLPDSEVVSIRDNAIEDVSLISRPALYDRAKRRKFAIPGAEIGSLLDYSYTIHRRRISFTTPFYFDFLMGDREPFLKDVVEVEVPSEFRIIHWERGVEPPDSALMEGKVVYRWVITDHMGLNREPLMPPPAYLLPEVVVGSSDDFSDIAKRYAQVLRDSSRIPEKIFEEFKGITDRDSLLLRVYTWVAREIKTVSLLADEFSYFPFSPMTVVENRFGTPLDKSFLLYCLLKNFGYPVDFLLVPDRTGGGLKEEVPSLSQFRTGLVLLADTLFLYPASEDGDMGYVEGAFQGVRGLSLKGKLVQIPFLSGWRVGDVSYLKVEFTPGGGASAELKREVRGREAIELRKLRALTSRERKKRVEEKLARVFPSSELEEFSLRNLDDLGTAVEVRIRFHLDDFYRELGRYVFFKLPGLNYRSAEAALEERKLPLYVEDGAVSVHRFVIEIPSEYEIRAMPTPLTCSSSLQSYEMAIKGERGKVIFEDRSERRAGYFESSDYSDFKRVIQKMAGVSKAWIVLEKSDSLK